ncbi:MAG: hypothetical protein LUJ25_02175 [Firmicutes bacterium]|nr:hypothetical protein [Bacillota bacterium]
MKGTAAEEREFALPLWDVGTISAVLSLMRRAILILLFCPIAAAERMAA